MEWFGNRHIKALDGVCWKWLTLVNGKITPLFNIVFDKDYHTIWIMWRERKQTCLQPKFVKSYAQFMLDEIQFFFGSAAVGQSWNERAVRWAKMEITWQPNFFEQDWENFQRKCIYGQCCENQYNKK